MPGHQPRLGAAGELTVENQERQPAEMVTVQMAHRHRAHRVRVQPLGLQRHQAGGPAVHQHRLLVSGQVNARLAATATAEGISAAREPHPHHTIVDHQPRQRTSAAERRLHRHRG